LSGSSATAGLLGYLAQAPRATANPTALTKMRSLAQWTGKITVPTVAMTGVADPVTPAGDLTYMAQQYAKQWQAAHLATLGKGRPAYDLIALFGTTPAHYTTFSATGAPITTTAAANGTNHCNFNVKQYIAVADMLAYASRTGHDLAGGALNTAVRKMGGTTKDLEFAPPLPKFYAED